MPALTAFMVAVLAALLVTLLQGGKPFHYDSGGYWDLSDTFTRDGQFSLFNFENTGLRGYALPLLYWALRNAAALVTNNESLVVRSFNVLTFAIVGTVLAPRLASLAWPSHRWNVPRRLGLTALILLFWSGYLSFPLSDFPALTAGLLALVAVSRVDSPAWQLVAGFSAGLALNMRPAYLLLVPALAGLLAWGWIERRPARISPRRRALCVGSLVVGLLIVSLPQSIFQHRQFGGFSPIPGTSRLTQLQYTAGLRLQRYDTYVSGPPRMEYAETHTGEIIAELDTDGVDGTVGYLNIVVKHPITMAGVFFRHIVNGLDHRYTTPYIETLEADRDDVGKVWHQLLRVGGFLLVFLALLRVAWPTGRRSLGPARWRYPTALLMASISSLPSAVETRFLLPAFVLSALLVIAPGWHQALSEFRADPSRRRKLALTFGAGTIYAVVVWTVVSATTDSLRLS